MECPNCGIWLQMTVIDVVCGHEINGFACYNCDWEEGMEIPEKSNAPLDTTDTE